MTQPPKPTIAEVAALTAAMHHGSPAFEARLDEMGGGFASGADGRSGTNAALGGPTVAAVIAIVDDGRTDVSADERKAWDRDVRRAYDSAMVLWCRYTRIAQVHPGVPRVLDPGCELCDGVPDHWCPTFATVEIVSVPKHKRDTPATRHVRLCSWCYERQRPDRAGHLPTQPELLAHSEGRRVPWAKGAKG